MNSEEKILALLEQQAKTLEQQAKTLEQQAKTLEQVKGRLDRLEECAEVTRDGVNALLEWADACSEAASLPLPKVGG